MALTAPEALAKLWRMPQTTRLPFTREWVYFLEAQMPVPLVKIGKSQELRWRVITLQYTSPVALKLIGGCSGPAGTERVLHAKFKSLRSHGEWFVLTEELRAFIASLPKGGPLPNGLAERWSSETGEPFLPKRREATRKDKGRFHEELRLDRDLSRHWNYEFSRID